MSEAIKITALVLMLLIIFSGCITSGMFNTTNETIKIGGMFVLSGTIATWGESAKNGVEIALKEENLNGGINGEKIEIIYEDTRGTSTDSISAYNKLTQIDEVIAILGPTLQNEIDSIAPLANQNNTPIMAITSGTNTSDYNKNIIFFWQDPNLEAGSIAEYIYTTGTRNVAILTSKDPWELAATKGFKDKFAQLGGKITSIEIANSDETDVHSQVYSALEKNPEAIFISSYYQYLNYSKLISESGYKGSVYGIEIDDWLANESRKYNLKIEFVSSQKYPKEFNDKYILEYDLNASIPSGQAYDATKLLIKLLRESENQNKTIIDLFYDFKSYNGISGEIKRNPDNRVSILPFTIYSLEKGIINEELVLN